MPHETRGGCRIGSGRQDARPIPCPAHRSRDAAHIRCSAAWLWIFPEALVTRVPLESLCCFMFNAALKRSGPLGRRLNEASQLGTYANAKKRSCISTTLLRSWEKGGLWDAIEASAPLSALIYCQGAGVNGYFQVCSLPWPVFEAPSSARFLSATALGWN